MLMILIAIFCLERCGPCLLMAPEFEAAAKEFEGKVRFVKLDTDKDPEISTR